MTDLKSDFLARMPAGFADVAGAPTQYDYQGNVTGFARTAEEVYANRAAQAYAMRETGGSAGVLDPARLDADDRRKALPTLTLLGVDTPPTIQEALAREGAVELALVPANPVLDLLSVPVEEIADRVREHVQDRQRESFLNTVSRDLRNQAAIGVVSAFRGSLSYVLAEKPIQDEFDSARDAFLSVFPVVQHCRSIGDAALLDETGAGVAAWHTARRAVARMDKIVETLILFAAPPKHTATGSLRGVMDTGGILGLSAAPVDTITYLSALAARGIDHHEHLRKPADEPFGLYGAQVEAGCVLSLPESAEDLADRAAVFSPYAAIADAMLGA